MGIESKIGLGMVLNILNRPTKPSRIRLTYIETRLEAEAVTTPLTV
jgi:hypothetical protein